MTKIMRFLKKPPKIEKQYLNCPNIFRNFFKETTPIQCKIWRRKIISCKIRTKIGVFGFEFQ